MKRNGWHLRSHALVLDQLERWITEAEADRGKAAASGAPDAFRQKPAFKLAVSLRKLMFDDVPSDPLGAKFRHGGTANISLDWFRAKFGGGRYRLFFKARRKDQRVLYVWVNSDETLRTYGSKTDAYAVFASLIRAKMIPADWPDLEKAITARDDERLSLNAPGSATGLTPRAEPPESAPA